MRINVWAFAAMVCLFGGVVAIGQDSPNLELPGPTLEKSSPAANPTDSAALAAPPAFVDSGPTLPVSDVDGKAQNSDTQPGREPESELKPVKLSETWTPRLIATLQLISTGREGKFEMKEVTAYRNIGDRMVAEKHFVAVPGNLLSGIVPLKCDDINVDVTANEDGTPSYNFSCKGKAVLTISGSQVSGDSMTSAHGTIVINNATLQMPDGTTMTSEKLSVSLPIIGISVGSNPPAPIKTDIPSAPFHSDEDDSFTRDEPSRVLPRTATPTPDPKFLGKAKDEFRPSNK